MYTYIDVYIWPQQYKILVNKCKKNYNNNKKIICKFLDTMFFFQSGKTIDVNGLKMATGSIFYQ